MQKYKNPLIRFLNDKYTSFSEDHKKFVTFYNIKFPILYYLLPPFQCVSFLSMLYLSKILNADYISFYTSLFNLGQVIDDIPEAYHTHLFFFVCLLLLF